MLTYIFRSSVAWTVIGLAGGLGYREFTRQQEFTGYTQLALVHTHALVWGTIFMLGLLALAVVLPGLTSDRRMRGGLHVFNAGLAITVGMLAFKGSVQVLGLEWADSPALAGISGTGHILLTVALVLLLLAVGQQVKGMERPVTSATPDAREIREDESTEVGTAAR